MSANIEIDPNDPAYSPEGVGRSGELAAATMDHLITTVEVARLDMTVTAVYLLAEVLAGLQVYADLSPAAALRSAELLVAPRVASLKGAQAVRSLH